MARKTKDSDITNMIKRMQEEGMDVEVDGAYGQYAVTNRTGSKMISPRMPNRHILDWLYAYQKGWTAGVEQLSGKVGEALRDPEIN